MRASVRVGVATGAKLASDMRVFIAALFCHLGADRHGATALMFAASAAILFGLVGLATEGGTWYVEKRHGQNAADAAAIAGALALYRGQTVSASAIAAATGTGSNYNSSNVKITQGFFNSANNTFTGTGAPTNAVQAVVTTLRSPLFSALFIGQRQVTISESAVATIAAASPVCALAESPGGTITFGGSASVQAPGCALASNGTDQTASPPALVGASTPRVSANQLLVSSGGCSGCTGTSPLTYQPLTTDPFAQTIDTVALQNTLKNKAGTQCNPLSGVSHSYLPAAYESTTPPSINCNDLTINSAIDLTPGTYIFYNSSISLSGGSLKCSACTGVGTLGVTIIITGNPVGSIGTINVGNAGTIALMAPPLNNFNSAFNGVLFYSDGNGAVGLTGSEASTFGGVLYFPGSAVTFIGNAGAVPSCSEVIGSSLIFNDYAAFDISGCSANTIPWTQSVRLIR